MRRPPLLTRRRPLPSLVAACATNTNDDDFVGEEEEDDRFCLPFETYCEEKMTMLSRTKAFDRLHIRGGVDPSVFLLCTFSTPLHQGLIRTHRRPPLTLIATVAKISERWNWKILKRMESVEESLLALSTPPENVQPAIGFEKELKRMRGRMETTKRAQMWKAAEDAEFWRGRGEEDEEEEKDGGDGTRKDDNNNNNNNNNNDAEEEEEISSSVFDASTKIACANIRAYFEYLGFQPTRAEWTSIQTLLGECLTSEKDRTMIIREAAIGGDADEDDARVSGGSSSKFRLLKRLIEHKTKKPRRDGERRQLNRRYLLARENLVEAKKEWAIAEKSYKEARRKMSRARHEVAKTRKHVRSEFR